MLLIALVEGTLRWRNAQHPVATRISLCCTVVILAGGAFAYVRWIETRSYPDLSGRIAFFDEAFRQRLKSAFRQEFQQKYGLPEENREALRILFLGGSQTWGAGASQQDRSFVARIEARLTEELGRSVQAMNGGLRSARTSWLATQLGEWMAAYKPALLVLNVSSNDNDITEFGINLAEIARIADRLDIPLLVVCEAESIEHRSDIEIFHTSLRSVAARLGVIAVEAHAYLQEHEDTGML